MEKDAKIFVAGHRGLVGSGICRRLAAAGFHNLATRTHSELDLTDAGAVEAFFAAEKPEYVFVAAAKVGGIVANSTYPVDFLRDNTLIQTHILEAARRSGCRKVLLLGSSCIYPRLAPQPLREDYLLTGPLEETNQWYAIAKISGILLGQAYRRQYGLNVISAMPTNLYGPGDNFDLNTSHVLPAMLRKFHEARRDAAPAVVLWGDGSPLREFLYIDDLADACLFLMTQYDSEEIVNVGTGKDVSIAALAEMVRGVVGYGGDIQWDTGKPNGTPRKLLDVSRLAALGWKASTPLREGIAVTYDWFAGSADARM